MCTALRHAICTPPHISSLHRLHVNKNAPPVTSSPFWKLCDLLHLNNQRYSNYMNCSVQDFKLSWQSILRQMMRPLSWLVPTNQEKTALLLVRWLPPLSCYCTNHCRPKQAPSFMKSGCFPPLLNETLLELFHVFCAPNKYLYFVTYKPSFILCFLRLGYTFLLAPDNY